MTSVQKFILLCLGLFLFVLFFHKGIETEDVWFHLKTGQWIIDHAQVPHQDLFPFANEKTPYLAHEWLASSFLYAVFKIGGFFGLKLFRSLFFMLGIGIFFLYSYRRFPFPFLVFLTLLMSYGLFQRSLLRPDTFNLLFIQLFLISLFSYERTGERWKLSILPLIGVFWVNIHMMGAFIYGGSILSIFWLSAVIRYLSRKKTDHSSDIAVDPKKQVKELFLTLLVFQAIFIINPYGLEGFLFPYKVILFPQYYGFYKMITIMRELQDSFYIFSSFDYYYFVLLLACPLLFLFLNKKKDLTLIFLFAFASLAFLDMTRNSSFFTIVAGYVIVRGAQNMGFTKIWRRVHWSSSMDMIILSVVTFCLILQIFNMCNERVYYDGKKHRAFFLATNPYVTSSMDLFKNNGINGPVFNSSILGASIIWYDYPQLRPFDDGRHLDYQRLTDLINVLSDPEGFWRKAEGRYGFKIVILNEGNVVEQKVIKYLQGQNDWQLIAIKGPFVIYVKRGAFHLSDQLNGFEQQLRSNRITDNDVSQLTLMSQREQRPGLEKFFDPSPYRVDLFSNGVTLMGLGYNGAAAIYFIEALQVSDQPYMQEIVGAFLNQLKYVKQAQ